jgi:hypothetical protein
MSRMRPFLFKLDGIIPELFLQNRIAKQYVSQQYCLNPITRGKRVPQCGDSGRRLTARRHERRFRPNPPPSVRVPSSSKAPEIHGLLDDLVGAGDQRPTVSRVQNHHRDSCANGAGVRFPPRVRIRRTSMPARSSRGRGITFAVFRSVIIRPPFFDFCQSKRLSGRLY